MARGKLFEYAVLYHPRKKEKDEVEKVSVLIVDKTSVLAATEQEVSIKAARSIPEEYLDKLQDVEILVRPF
jgi:hypothetical protein